MADGCYYGGVEGGSTHTRVVLLNAGGTPVADKDERMNTNQWQVGQDECVRRLAELVTSAKRNAGIEVPLTALGLSLSGADNAEVCRALEQKLGALSLSLPGNIVVCRNSTGLSISTRDPNTNPDPKTNRTPRPYP